MARKPTKQPEIETPFELVVSRKDAEEKIQDRIEKGRELLIKEIRSWESLESVKKEYYKWSDYNEELLTGC